MPNQEPPNGKPQSQEPSAVFTSQMAADYDERFAKMSPMRDAMQMLTRALLSDLPAQAHVLCVGVGTGLELADMAQAFPGWQFTGVEPSAPMLDICRQRVAQMGIESRCTLHEGYLDSLHATEPFDAATCLLVSHFVKVEERRDFFAQIASRLKVGGTLVNADLTSSGSPDQETLLELWQRTLRYAGHTEEQSRTAIAHFNKLVFLLTPAEMESTLEAAGFAQPTLFLQTLLIRGWHSWRR